MSDRTESVRLSEERRAALEAGAVTQERLVRLAGYRVTVNGSPAEIINNTVRCYRAIGYFEFAEDHGGQWSQDGLTWWIDGKEIKFTK